MKIWFLQLQTKKKQKQIPSISNDLPREEGGAGVG